jgi:hypothetical protein
LSAQHRDRLIAEAHELSSSDAAAGWAHKSLADKNKPTEGDAQAVEQAFRARLEALGIGNKDPSVAAAPNPAASAAHEPNVRRSKPKRRRRSHPIDESVLAMLEPRRLRDRDHVRSVAQHLGRRPGMRTISGSPQSKVLGREVSEEFTVPIRRIIVARSIAAAMKQHGGKY